MEALTTTGTLPTILLVDDDPHLLELLTMVVASWGWEAVAAANVAEAIELMEHRGPPTAVVVDYRLANVENGLMVIEELRRRFGDDIPALVMTGDPGSLALKQIPGSDVHLLRKPLHPQRLQQLVEALSGVGRLPVAGTGAADPPA